MPDCSYIVSTTLPGLGKTDLVVALAEASMQAGHLAYFMTVAASSIGTDVT